MNTKVIIYNNKQVKLDLKLANDILYTLGLKVFNNKVYTLEEYYAEFDEKKYTLFMRNKNSSIDKKSPAITECNLININELKESFGVSNE